MDARKILVKLVGRGYLPAALVVAIALTKLLKPDAEAEEVPVS